MKILHNPNLTLSKICQLVNFPYGEIWYPKAENELLALSSHYHIEPNHHQSDLEFFHESSNEFILSKGEGLPGQSLLNKAPKWSLDISEEFHGYFSRSILAEVCGVKTGFAIPITIEGKVFMVMTFFTYELRYDCTEWLELVHTFAIEFSAIKACHNVSSMTRI